jgi:hypothetical protein
LTEKARTEAEADDLDLNDIRESIVNASGIYKSIRSSNPYTGKREYLHIIKSESFSGICIYTKGKLVVEDGIEVLYLLVSSKRAI